MNQNDKPRTGRNGEAQNLWQRMVASGGRQLARLGLGDRRMVLSVLGGLALCVGAFISFSSFSRFSGGSGFEVGKVADRDIVAERDLVYIDDAATAMRVDLERRQVAPIFVINDAQSQRIRQAFSAFHSFFLDNRSEELSEAAWLAILASRYPALAEAGVLGELVAYQAPATLLGYCQQVLERLLDTGIVDIPERGLDPYNPQLLELRKWLDGALVYEQIEFQDVLTLYNIGPLVEGQLRRLGAGPALASLGNALLRPFLQPNAFFDEALSRKRLDSVGAAVEPVMRRISQGERVIRKGFVVTEQDLQRFNALRRGGSRFSFTYAFGGSFFLLFLFVAALFFFSSRVIGSHLNGKRFYLVLILAVVYFILASALAAFLPVGAQPYLAAFIPTALLAMLMAILINERFAILYTLLLSLSLLPISGFDVYLFTHSFIAGSAGAFLVRRTEKRIDLVRAGAQLALIQFAAAIALGALFDNNLQASLIAAFWQALNAFFCGTLTLGFLPVLEHALNASTVFRLQELSDLNAPALKMLLSIAPGTYSHSVTVAHLAESACREIGASALLARVGAYYHDIGKIEQPEYFIENQAGYNKHDDINPRLSATVLRSHVKFGLERAEGLALPDDVRAIIAEHHGTSLISYFFAQAQKEAGDTKSEDYRYPGPLPGSKESAVVMLADCVEAASRTLKKPTMAKLEQFVKEMIAAKTESGQLARSALTFHDLEIIKNTFVRILAGHFHSRIEYPRLKEAAR